MVEVWAAPSIAVVLEAGQGGPWLAVTLASVLRAGEGLAWELVVVLDASAPPAARAMLQAFARQLPPQRLTLLEIPAGPAALARNQGWQACQAPIVVFLASGQRLDPRRLRLPLEAFGQHDSLALLACGWEVEGIVHQPWLGSGDVSPQALLGQRDLLASCLSVRRRWLERLGGFPEDLPACSALDLVIRLTAGGGQLAWLAETLLRCRRNDQLGSPVLAMERAWSGLHRTYGEGIRPGQLVQSRFAAMAWCGGLAWQQQQTEVATGLLTKAATLAPLPVPRARMQVLEALSRSARWCGVQAEPPALMTSPLWRHCLELWP